MWNNSDLNNYLLQYRSKNLRICKLFSLANIWYHFTDDIFKWYFPSRYQNQLKVNNNLGRIFFMRYIICGKFRKSLLEYNLWSHQYSDVHQLFYFLPWKFKDCNIPFLKRFRQQINGSSTTSSICGLTTVSLQESGATPTYVTASTSSGYPILTFNTSSSSTLG